jgi:ATP-dependent helicase/nuclease subunit A
MKQRILKLLNMEDKTLFNILLDKMPLMRVSTIHSFCSSLLRRFSFEADIDPNYRVEDATDARMRWEEILYEVLMGAARGSRGHDLLVQTLSERGFRGLDYLKQTMDYLFMKSPFTFEAVPFTHNSITDKHLAGELKEWPGAAELIDGYRAIFDKNDLQSLLACEQLFLTSAKNIRSRQPGVLKGIHSYREWASVMYAFWRERMLNEYARITVRLGEIFRTCSDKYASDKRARGLVDFSDLEYLAYKMLTGHPQWANILYAFDEKTDHILVDEFQDTNSFQWEIINQLTEEWRSGMGAKREQGIRPTIFLVGDDKQSVYYFRGANVELFHGAKEKLHAWLKDEFVFEEVKENFRSLPAIVEFTNHIFPKIMQTSEDSHAWITRYSTFHAQRPAVPDPGKVELILLGNDSENTVEAKKREAEILARRINGLVNDYRITDKATLEQRPSRYMDMAILLRRRTHLKIYEEALRKFNIPFVAVKGIGFYQEPEVAMMRAFVFFLSNPRDDYSLYIILKSPVFNIDENSILHLIQRDGDSLYSKLGSAVKDPENAQADKRPGHCPCPNCSKRFW